MLRLLFYILVIAATVNCSSSDQHRLQVPLDISIYNEIIQNIIEDDFSCFKRLPPIPPNADSSFLINHKITDILIYDSLISENNINQLVDTTFEKLNPINHKIEFSKSKNCQIKIYHGSILNKEANSVILIFSRIYLDKNLKKGYFTVIVYTNGDDSEKYLFSIEKRNNNWEILDEEIIWVS